MMNVDMHANRDAESVASNMIQPNMSGMEHMNEHTDVLVNVDNLCVTIDTFRGPLQAVRHNSLTVRAGEILGIVGESGCGKSVTANALMGLLPLRNTVVTADTLMVDGHDCRNYTESDWNTLRSSTVAMVFQDPMTALNPILSIGTQLYEVITRTPAYGESYDKRAIAIDLLTKMGISSPEKRLKQYPHELSGGMRQRVVIAMALAGKPKLILADEPTTALDVTTEVQILKLLQQLAKEEGIGVIFISHNLRVVAQLCDRVMVMYAGQCVESGPVEDIFLKPSHPYTQGLLRSLPQGKARGELVAIEGQPPDVYVLPTGCAFHPRCPDAMNICAKEEPLMSGQVQHELEGDGQQYEQQCGKVIEQPQVQQHVYRCWLARKEASL